MKTQSNSKLIDVVKSSYLVLVIIDPVVAVLGSHGFRPKRSPPVIAVGQHTFIQLLYTPPDEFYYVQLDLLLAESELQR